MTIAWAIYRAVHRAKCNFEKVFCWKCDASHAEFYCPAIVIDAFGLGLAIVEIVKAIKAVLN